MQHQFYEREDGLKHCSVCGGAEASLPKECPNKKMATEVEDAVQSRLIDYYDGSWWWIDSRCKLTETQILLCLHYDSCVDCDLTGPPDYCPIYQKIREEAM